MVKKDSLEHLVFKILKSNYNTDTENIQNICEFRKRSNYLVSKDVHIVFMFPLTFAIHVRKKEKWNLSFHKIFGSPRIIF